MQVTIACNIGVLTQESSITFEIGRLVDIELQFNIGYPRVAYALTVLLTSILIDSGREKNCLAASMVLSVVSSGILWPFTSDG